MKPKKTVWKGNLLPDLPDLPDTVLLLLLQNSCSVLTIIAIFVKPKKVQQITAVLKSLH